MFRFVCILALCASVYGAALEGVPQLDGRIVGGQPTTIDQYPYQVSLAKSGSHFCGGSLYSSNVVITAAHCLQGGVSPSVIKVRLGSTSRTSGGIVVDVASYKNHQGYNSKTHANDIAIIRLAKDVQFTESIRPITMATQDPAPGTPAVVTGWGTTKEGAFTLPTTLQEVTVDIVSRQSCQNSYGSKYDINASMLCAASPNKDACQGDSGGPLVANGKLVGVVSWGFGCARDEYPGVYSSVATLRDFVIENVI